MGLFDNAKKAAAVGTSVAAAAAGTFAGQSIARELHNRQSDSSSNSDSPNTSPPSLAPNTHHYPNGNILIEHANGNRIFYDAVQRVKTEYDAHTGHTATHPTTAQEINQLLHAHAQTVTSSQAAVHPSAATDRGLFNTVNNHTDATGSTDPSVKVVNEVHTHQEGSLKDGHFRFGFETKHGLQFDHHAEGSSHDQVVPGATLDTQASFQTHHEIGATTQGDVNAQWNNKQAELHAHVKAAVGAESSASGHVNSTLDIKGINAKPEAALDGQVSGVAGAKAEGQGDALFNRHGGRVGAQGEALAGAKASANGSGVIGVDGHEVASMHGGVEASAGVGAGGRFHAGYEHGKIHYDIGGSITAGVGVGAHYGGSVSAPGIVTHPDAVIATYVPHDVSQLVQHPTEHLTQQVVNHLVPHDVSQLVQHPTEHLTQQVMNHVPELPNVVHHAERIIAHPSSLSELFE